MNSKTKAIKKFSPASQSFTAHKKDAKDFMSRIRESITKDTKQEHITRKANPKAFRPTSY